MNPAREKYVGLSFQIIHCILPRSLVCFNTFTTDQRPPVANIMVGQLANIGVEIPSLGSCKYLMMHVVTGILVVLADEFAHLSRKGGSFASFVVHGMGKAN